MKEFAVCISGQPRCIYEGERDFKRLFKDLEYDVFIHAWDSNELLSSWGHNMGFENKKTKVYSANELVELYNPKSSLKEEYNASQFYKYNIESQGYRHPTNKVYSSYSQFYSIKKSFDVLSDFEKENNIKYKYAVKYRMDLDVDFDFSKLFTDDDISTEWIQIKNRLDENPNLIITNPGYDWPNGNGVSNLLAIGNTEAMYKFSKVFDHYPWLLQNCKFPEYDEANLKLYLEQICGLRVESCSINVGVYR